MQTALLTFFDILLALFSLVLAMSAGALYQPNILVLSAAFLSTRIFILWLWFKWIRSMKTAWLRLAGQSIFLTLILVFLLAILNLLFVNLPDRLFWFLAAPSAVLIVSLIIHKFYKLSYL